MLGPRAVSCSISESSWSVVGDENEEQQNEKRFIEIRRLCSASFHRASRTSFILHLAHHRSSESLTMMAPFRHLPPVSTPHLP